MLNIFHPVRSHGITVVYELHKSFMLFPKCVPREISGIHILHEIGMSYWIRFAIKKTINIKMVDIVSESIDEFQFAFGNKSG